VCVCVCVCVYVMILLYDSGWARRRHDPRRRAMYNRERWDTPILSDYRNRCTAPIHQPLYIIGIYTTTHTYTSIACNNIYVVCRRSDDSRSIYGHHLSLYLYICVSRFCCCAAVVCSLFLEFFFSPVFFSWPPFIMRSRSLVFIYVLGAVAKEPPRRWHCTLFASCSKVASLCVR